MSHRMYGAFRRSSSNDIHGCVSIYVFISVQPKSRIHNDLHQFCPYQCPTISTLSYEMAGCNRKSIRKILIPRGLLGYHMDPPHWRVFQVMVEAWLTKKRKPEKQPDGRGPRPRRGLKHSILGGASIALRCSGVRRIYPPVPPGAVRYAGPGRPPWRICGARACGECPRSSPARR